MQKIDKIEFFLIGTQKAGTTTLYDWLSQHPNISAPQSVKDLHFFSKPENLKKGVNWLHRQYNRGSQIHMLDGSVNYLCQNEVPARLHTYNPDAKFLVVLRDPVKRAYSAYQFFRKLSKEKRAFHEAIAMELHDPASRWDDRSNFAYVEHGFYFKQLQRWYNYFKPDQFYILLYEELFKNPQLYLPCVFQFLNIDPSFTPNFLTKNQTGSPRYKWLNSIIYGEGRIRNLLLRTLKIKYLLPAPWRLFVLNNFRDWNTKIGANSERLTKEEYLSLHTIFEEDTRKLSELLRIDLARIWTY